jgi:N-glycosylase/DNA lyase
MKIRELENGIIIEDIQNFHPVETFECGQCFRWNETEDNTYIGVVRDKVLEVELKDGDLYIYNITIDDFYDRWMDYFDLARDYNSIQRQLEGDEVLKKAIPHGKGIRLLNQDEWETLISFIISSNKNIPHIKIIVEKLCQSYGDKLEYRGKTYYTFPTPQQLSNLSIDEIAQSKCGYRAKFIHSAIERVNTGKINLYSLKELPIEQTIKQLISLYGVGPKIADCVMLFSMGKFEAFPTDVWVKRVMEYFYFQEDASIKDIKMFANKKWGKLAGYAQQYLFHYARNIVGKK